MHETIGGHARNRIQVLDRIVERPALEQGLVYVRLRPAEQDACSRQAGRVRRRRHRAKRRRHRCSQSPPCRAEASACPPMGDRRGRMRRPAERGQPAGSAATDRLAPMRCATRPTARPRPLPDARICGGEVSQRVFLSPRFHSITSSARASSVGGTVRPSVFAVLRLITSSYLVGVCTGRSAGFSPLRMRST